MQERKQGTKKIVDGKFIFDNYIEGRFLFHTRPDGSLMQATINDEPSMTQQQFAAECDINNIMKHYLETGTINYRNPNPGVFADFSQIGDLRESLEQIRAAEETFNLLPAQVRARFSNGPMQFVDFCGDPKNLDEAVSLGLAHRPQQNNPNDLNEPLSPSGTKKPSSKDSGSSSSTPPNA